MQYARCIEDNVVWEAEKLAALPPRELEAKRQNLLCTECGEFAWFRKQSSHGHPAHFCAHHADGCGLKVEYVVVDEKRADATVAEGQLESSETMVVRLDQERGTEIDVTNVQRPPTPGVGAGGTRYIRQGPEGQTAQQFTLRKILLRLVQSPNFRASDKSILLYKNETEVLIRGAVRDVVAGFDEITRERHHEKLMLYWGPIASAAKTEDGKLWLNSSDRYQSASVSIFADVVDEFLATFHVDDLEDLAGAHVLVAGRCSVAATGKPVIWCGTTKYIVVRRYEDEKLKAVL